MKRYLTLLLLFTPATLGSDGCEGSECLSEPCAETAEALCGGEPLNFICGYSEELGCTVLVTVDCGVVGPE